VDPPAHAIALLGPDRARYEAATSEPLRRRLAASRWLLRSCAGALLGRSPALVPLTTGPNGRPMLDGTGYDVSITHTGTAVLVALAAGHRVGTDLEPLERAPVLSGMERTVCSPAELAAWSRLLPGERHAFLLRRWTLKEAYGKAVGLGLGLRFDSYGFQWRAGHPARTDARGRPVPAAGWAYRSDAAAGLGLIGLALGPPR